jgi:hypothetical protein
MLLEQLSSSMLSISEKLMLREGIGTGSDEIGRKEVEYLSTTPGMTSASGILSWMKTVAGPHDMNRRFL